MSKSSENQKLNPQIAEIEIGIRNLRKIKIYPLAAGPQLKLIDKFKDIANIFTSSANDEIVGHIIGIIRNELPNIIAQIIPIGETTENILNEITIKQLEDLVLLIYQMNFESIAKNLQGLFGQILAGAEVVEELNSRRSKSQ